MNALEFKAACVEALRYRLVDLDGDLDYADGTAGGLYKLTEAWCQERAAQLACIFVGAMAEAETTPVGRAISPLNAEQVGAVPVDEAGGGEDPMLDRR